MGTGSGEKFELLQFDGTAVSPDVAEKGNAALDPMETAPAFIIHENDPDNEELVGSERFIYEILVSLIITDEHTKVVDGTTLSEKKLARYMSDEFRDAMRASKGKWANTKVTGVSADVRPTSNRKGQTDFYGFIASVVVRFN